MSVSGFVEVASIDPDHQVRDRRAFAMPAGRTARSSSPSRHRSAGRRGGATAGHRRAVHRRTGGGRSRADRRRTRAVLNSTSTVFVPRGPVNPADRIASANPEPPRSGGAPRSSIVARRDRSPIPSAIACANLVDPGEVVGGVRGLGLQARAARRGARKARSRVIMARTSLLGAGGEPDLDPHRVRSSVFLGLAAVAVLDLDALPRSSV